MSYRRFTDADGARWEIRMHAKGDWEFRPVPGNPGRIHLGAPPLHTTDPFEVSEQELRRMLADASPRPSRSAGSAPSPFRDDDGDEASGGGGIFGQPRPRKKRSPFLDDRED